MILRGKLMEYDMVNSNNLTYPKKAVIKEVKKFNRNHEDRRLGTFELNETAFKSSLNLGDITHKAKDLEIDESNNAIIATLEIIDTPLGKNVQELFKRGFKFAPCIVGNINLESNKFELERVDIISEIDAAWPGCELKEVK